MENQDIIKAALLLLFGIVVPMIQFLKDCDISEMLLNYFFVMFINLSLIMEMPTLEIRSVPTFFITFVMYVTFLCFIIKHYENNLFGDNQ